jgi:LmbE family N-acetylglucosaminyl deacetylase
LPRRKHAVAIAVLAMIAGCTDQQQSPTDQVIARRSDVGSTHNTQVFVVAHQDDWQLFLGAHAADHAAAGKLVFIYTTAGDAGRTATQPDYYPSRELAAMASVDSLAAGGAWACAGAAVNGHTIRRCANTRAVSYFMRLPDGGGDGAGFGQGSLNRLRDQGEALSALDGSTTYVSWQDLISTVAAAIDAEGTQANVAVHAPEYNRGTNDGDHPDHHATGDLVKRGTTGHVWDMTWFLGYRIGEMPVNVSAADQARAWRVFLGYDAVMVARMGETLIGNSHAEDWTQRIYSRNEVSTGAAPTPPAAPSNVILNVYGPRITTLNWNDNATDEAMYKVERAPDVNGVPGAWTEVATTNSSNFWEDTNATPGAYNWYRLRGFSYHAGNGPYSPPMQSNNVFWDVYLTAHQDDWQLFFGNRAAHNMLNGAKVVVIFTTAGDAGTATSLPAYWQARETASLAAFNSVTPAGPTTCAQQTVNGHPIKRCVKINAVSYFMRLPDGNGEGQGYGNWGSLENFRNAGPETTTPFRAIDGSTQYANWADLVRTIQGIVDLETNNGSGARLRVHGFEPNREISLGDHSDHLATADLIKAASSGHVWELSHYVGYQIVNMPVNLPQPEIDLKWRVFLPYDSVMVQLMGETLIGTSSVEDWVRRTYFRDANSWGDLVRAPVAPTGLVATAANGTRINLTWVDESVDEDGFEIERSPNEFNQPTGEWTRVARVGADVRTWANNGLPNDTRYWYRVRAFNWMGYSGYTNREDATTTFPPVAPTNLVATAVGSRTVDLSWTDNSTNETQFRIERAADNAGVPGAWVQQALVGANVTTYRTPSNLAANTAYWFRVRAQVPGFNSVFTNEATATTTLLVPPSGLVVNGYLVGTQRNADLTWTPGSEPLIDVWRNSTKVGSNLPNNGGVFNNRPGNGNITYKVCVAGINNAANCTAVVPATF